MQMLEEIKKQLRPDTSVLVEIELFVKEINKEIQKNKIKADCVKGGSVAKGTFLKEDYDVDLFVKFDYSYKEDNISYLLKKILARFKPELIHGSRDYFQLKNNKLNYEIVPVLDVKDSEKALNVTDMSPMHVSWVKKNLKKNQEDEIRLSKKFCKSIGVYGAESYISGFSGHVIDILIIYYRSFLELLKKSQDWKPKTIIDPENYYKTKQDVLFNLNQSKIQGPLIVIDPVLKTRNAASALSYEKFSLFKKKAKEFLSKPDKSYFEEKQIGKTYLKLKYKNKKLFILSIETRSGKKDVIGSKLLKAFKYMKSELKKIGFEITDSGWHWKEKKHALFWLVFKEDILAEKRKIEGPPLEMKNACTNFKKKYKKTFQENKKLFAEIKVEKRTASENIKEISSSDYFKEKASLKNINS
jgi:tRNA nucleotidyltransferase (CCA-adding enzyme)